MISSDPSRINIDLRTPETSLVRLPQIPGAQIPEEILVSADEGPPNFRAVTPHTRAIQQVQPPNITNLSKLNPEASALVERILEADVLGSSGVVIQNKNHWMTYSRSGRELVVKTVSIFPGDGTTPSRREHDTACFRRDSAGNIQVYMFRESTELRATDPWGFSSMQPFDARLQEDYLRRSGNGTGLVEVRLNWLATEGAVRTGLDLLHQLRSGILNNRTPR